MYKYSRNNWEDLIVNSSVPICPICDKPVPVKRGDDPNIRVSFFEACVQYATINIQLFR